MSKQYLTTHTVDDGLLQPCHPTQSFMQRFLQSTRSSGMLTHVTTAHITDIFCLASTPTCLLSVSGSSTIHVYSTTSPAFPLAQSFANAHKLGCHHVCTSASGAGLVAASVGFGGEVKVWTSKEGSWDLWHTITPADNKAADKQAGPNQGSGGGNANKTSGDTWAVSLSADEQYLACTTADGRIHVWDIVEKRRIQTYDTGGGGTGGSFAMSVDLSRDGRFTASGHANGAVYVFNNDAGRLMYSLPSLAKPVRAVAFSPGCKRLAAAGDAGIIALYDMEHGEHVGNLSAGGGLGQIGAAWITSIDWNETGEYLLSGSFDGKARVWDIERAACVATHSETDSALWSVRWLRRPSRAAAAPGMGKGEMFCAAGANKSISFYREATGV